MTCYIELQDADELGIVEIGERPPPKTDPFNIVGSCAKGLLA
ncbi:MAG TPA: hypothetical protein VGI59_02130 [Candidatus Udaeobacter sp.]